MNKNKKLLLIILSIACGMVGLAFASVPLYRLFCQATGFGGMTLISTQLPDTILDRQIKIQFNADTSRNLPWSFKPEKRSITVNVGQQGLINFITKNNDVSPHIGTALYNVTPLKAGKYFHKTQCFCFNAQTLKAQESMNMPVMFYIDPSIAEDKSMDDVETITLSYTFFKADTKELEAALEAFYNAE